MNQRSTSVASGEASKTDPVVAGGDITFLPGRGKPSGSIIFALADGREMMRFDPDGDVYVRGNWVDDNVDIYLHFKRWLGLAHITPAEDCEPSWNVDGFYAEDKPTENPNAGRQQSEPLGGERDNPCDLYKKCVYAGETGVPEVFVDGCWHPLADYSVINLHEQGVDAGTGVGGDIFTGPSWGVRGDGISRAMAVGEEAAARDGKTRVTHSFVWDYLRKVKP